MHRKQSQMWSNVEHSNSGVISISLELMSLLTYAPFHIRKKDIVTSFTRPKWPRRHKQEIKNISGIGSSMNLSECELNGPLNLFLASPRIQPL